MDRETREALNEGLRGRAWQVVWREGILPIVRTWRHRLLTDPNLPEAERRGLVVALNELKRGVEGVYRKVDAEIPPWLSKELGLDDGTG